jgi:hypothetical protein
MFYGCNLCLCIYLSKNIKYISSLNDFVKDVRTCLINWGNDGRDPLLEDTISLRRKRYHNHKYG